MRRVAMCVVVALASGCTVPYQPLEAEVKEMPLDAFDRTLDIVRALYPRLVMVDAKKFSIQSAWIPHDDDRAGQKRATVFKSRDKTIGVVVETRYLGIDLFGEPKWSAVRGDPALERVLMDAVLSVLEL